MPPAAERSRVVTMTKRDQLLECMAAMERGMLIAGTADHAFQIDVPRLLWWICKAVLLLIEKELKK